MNDSSSQPSAGDTQLREILARLTTIAQALVTTASTAPSRTPATAQQSATIVDYLALREAVGRTAVENSLFVAATRRPGGVIAFPSDALRDGTQVAVFTARGLPAEQVGLGSASKGRGGRDERTVTLATVGDDQPIIRIELRRDDDTTVALGPRLAVV